MNLIPSEFLEEVAAEHGLSDSELVVLSLALNDHSTNEISDELGGADVVSPDAVRQRLRTVYKKFNIGKESHRKLAKLQKMLLSRYQERQNRMSKKKVLILWSSEGERLALALKDTILQHERIEAWVSREDMAMDKLWLPGTQATTQLLEDTDFIVGCLTRSSSTWLNFKLGFLLGRSKNVKLLQFNKLGGPIADVPLIDGTKKEQLVELVSEIIDDSQKAKAWVDRTFPDFELVSKSVLKNADKDDLNQDISLVKEAAEGLKENQYIRDNKCFREILIKSLSEISGQLKDTQTSYSIPAALYPHHLISLQKELNVRVKALALVDHEEHFWPEETGRSIGDSAQEESIRVFVFVKPEDLERNFETLLVHAKEYKVCAMSYQKLTREFPPDFCKDFSIIKAPDDSRVLAEYVGRGLLKTISFIAWDGVSGTVSIHEKMLDKIIDSAIPIPKLNESQKSQLIRKKIMEQIRERVFKPSLSSAIGMKPIEMSAYIDVEDYDQHEEKHAYYQEMMNRMIDIILEHRNEGSKIYRVLEVGAGTGIFTKRVLAKIPNIELVAVELDWVCFHRLKHSIHNSDSVKFINDDSCTYVDPVGQFDCIVSSFSDHHIKAKDKKGYFQNLKQNLAPKGIIVVGDEFLASYDLNDNDARQVALKNYHNHIIEIAEKEGEAILAQLELAALKSGLEGIGDFKVSCEEYEDLLTTSSLKFEKEKIGPLNRNDIGGVYTYKIRAQN
jgi:SAM-dependent methyltransferase